VVYLRHSDFPESPYEVSGPLFQPDRKRLRMSGQWYRLKTSTSAIRAHNGQWLPTNIPAGCEIEVVAGPAEGDRLLDVLWEGNAVKMFPMDVREHGEPLAGRS
jgi:hypothetical protein